jgi:transcriptional regulator with XRE-family HTH domain
MSYALGHNRNYINSIELQRHLPSLAEFFEICNFLHVSPGEFFSPQEDEECTFDTALKKSTEPLNLLFEEMTPEQSNSVFNMLNELLR